MRNNERTRRKGHQGQPRSQTRSKKESKIYRREKDKSPEGKGRLDNLRQENLTRSKSNKVRSNIYN